MASLKKFSLQPFSKGCGVSGQRPDSTVATVEIPQDFPKLRKGAERFRGNVSAWGTLVRGSPECLNGE